MFVFLLARSEHVSISAFRRLFANVRFPAVHTKLQHGLVSERNSCSTERIYDVMWHP